MGVFSQTYTIPHPLVIRNKWDKLIEVPLSAPAQDELKNKRNPDFDVIQRCITAHVGFTMDEHTLSEWARKINFLISSREKS